MADAYVQASVAFTVHACEAALLEEAFVAARDWDDDGVTFAPSAAFAAHFPPAVPGEAWSGLQTIFSDPDFPTFGAKITIEALPGDPRQRKVIIYGLHNFDVDAVAELIRRCCSASLLSGPIGFDYALSCSKPVPGQFGGGWMVIHHDRIESGNTSDALAAALGQTRS